MYRVPSDEAVRSEAESDAHGGTDFLSVAECGVGLALGGIHAWVAILNGIPSQDLQCAPQGCKGPVVGPEYRLKGRQVMRPGHNQAEFLNQSFEMLLGRLLAVEANLVMKRLSSGSRSSIEPARDEPVFFGLPDPFPCHLFHTGPCPWTRFLAGTNPRPGYAAASIWVCGP